MKPFSIFAALLWLTACRSSEPLVDATVAVPGGDDVQCPLAAVDETDAP